ncbi:MAG: DNA polymerase III subunit alpha [SAR86 cluster bacterium]|nr:DNA polymerase III subunit alpha [SAR86 cluster bacterium]
MEAVNFIHLHLHSEYSLSDGIIRIEDLVNRTLEMGYPAVALTDLSNLFGLIKFYRLAREKGIKPIIGSEINLIRDIDSTPASLVLLVKNKTGYTNLTKLVSNAYIEGQDKGEPFVELSWLQDYSEGLIALSGGQNGHVGQALLTGNLKLASKRLNYFKNIFKEDFFLEMSKIGKENEEEYNNLVLKLSIKENIPIVATNDVRFLSPIDPEDSPSDFEAHEARVCIQRGDFIGDSNRKKEYTENQYFLSPEEIKQKFSDFPEAINNTVEIAKKCNLELDLGHFFLPDFQVPEGNTTESYLKDLSERGLKKRLDQIRTSDNSYSINQGLYSERLEYELNMICKLGFAGYFLIVADFVNWAKKNDIPVGPGRGSGAGSITAYALGITSIDPIKYDLLFERFLNPERVSNPDFDIDFCMEGRDRVLEYVTKKYGKNSVAQISTRGTMAARAVVRDVVRVLGKSYGFGDKLAKAIPEIPGISLKQAYKEKEFKELIDSSNESREVFDMALKLEGLSRSVGTHAAGVVIAPTALTDFTPLIVDAERGTVATQFDMGDVESAGLVKFDFLGLKTLTVINETVKRINLKLDSEQYINIDNLPLNDEKTFQLLQKAKTAGIFQLESRGMREYLKQLVPNTFEDIVNMNALYRPGAMKFVDSYIKKKHGMEEVTYGNDILKKILSNTYGIIVYQEQVMQIAQELSGFTLGQADILRRAMGKKKKEEMEEQRSAFIEGAMKREVKKDVATNLFELINEFAGYGFNKSHSVGYALIAYQTAWLKAHYPSEFLASTLSCELDSTDRIQMFVEDCRSMDLKVNRPDINKSDYLFKDLDKETILYGLGAIKGIGESLVSNIIEARKEKEFEDLYDFCLRVGSNRVNKRILTALIGSGAMDSFGSRQDIFQQIESVLKSVNQVTERQQSHIQDLFGSNNDLLDLEEKKSNDNPFDPIASEWSALGFYLESHPIDNRKEEIRKMCGTFIQELESSTQIQRVAGVLMHLNVRQGKNGRFAFATIDDSTGKLDISIWADVFDKYRSVLKKGQILVIQGMVEKDDYYSDSESTKYKMSAERVLSFDQARQEYLKHVKVFIDPGRKDVKEITNGIKGLPTKNGGCPVLISYLGKRASADVRLPEQFNLFVNDESLASLKSLCGNENVDLVYHAGPHFH